MFRQAEFDGICCLYELWIKFIALTIYTFEYLFISTKFIIRLNPYDKNNKQIELRF